MKTIITTLIIVLHCIAVQAQELKPTSIIKGRHHEYKIDSIGHRRLSIINNDGAYHKKKPRNDLNFDIKKVDDNSTVNTFREVFSDTRLKELLNEPNLGIDYYVTADGKIKEIRYLLNKNTSFTMTELQTLEDALIKNIAFVFPKGRLKGDEFIVVSQNVRFSRILDGTQP